MNIELAGGGVNAPPRFLAKDTHHEDFGPAGMPASPPASLTLFDLTPDPDQLLEPVEALSAGRRRTVRQHAAVAAGQHPLTKTRTRPELGTCGECAFRSLRYGFPKCTFGADLEGRKAGPYMTHGAGTDCRAWWPACDSFRRA